MTQNKLLVSAPFALALIVGGCGGSSKQSETAYCPQPFTVQDAGRITHFGPTAGRDPRDVQYEAVLVSASTSCSLRTNQMDVTLMMRVAVAAGPSVVSGTTSVPYFVRVLNSAGTVVQGQDFTADFKLSSGNPRGQSQEELSLRLPFAQAGEIGGYRIAVGLRPSPEELDYNRRGNARP